MKCSTQLIGTASAFALAAAPTVAVAAPVGTAAGTDITNQVSVTYQVGGVTQTTPVTSNTDTFKVDRKIDLTVTTQDASAVLVTPGQTNAVTTFTVTNNTNATIDFLLAATQQVSGTAKFTGSDTANVSNVRIYVETNGSAGWQLADAQASSLASVASGDAVTVYVVSDAPVGMTQGQIATVILTATAASGVAATTGYAGTGGSAVTEFTAATNAKTTEERVFADTAAETQTGDTAKNGKHAARSDYKVDTATLSLNKVSRIVPDAVNNPSNMHIPGATIEYCIVIQNTSTSVDATTVKIADNIDTTKLETITVPTLGGTFNGTDTCSGGAAGTWGTAGPTTWEYTFATVAKNTTSLLRFQAKIK